MATTDTLVRLREIRDVQRRASALIPERDRLIRRALLKERWSQRQVAKAAGLSQSRVNQIVK